MCSVCDERDIFKISSCMVDSWWNVCPRVDKMGLLMPTIRGHWEQAGVQGCCGPWRLEGDNSPLSKSHSPWLSTNLPCLFNSLLTWQPGLFNQDGHLAFLQGRLTRQVSGVCVWWKVKLCHRQGPASARFPWGCVSIVQGRPFNRFSGSEPKDVYQNVGKCFCPRVKFVSRV